MKSLATGASPPEPQKPIAHTTQALRERERDSVSVDPTSSFDSLDTVSTSSEESGDIDIKSDAESDVQNGAQKASPDPLQDMALHTLSPQAQAVREASLTGSVRLREAIDGNKLAEVKALLRMAPYLLNEPLSNGETPLQRAVAQGNAKMVALLLSRKGIDPNKTGADGWTPLCLAVHKNAIGIAAQLLKHARTNPDSALPNGTTPLYLAAANDHRHMAQQLLRAGADIHQAKRGGFTPLHAACHAGHLAMVRWLLKQPALWRPNGATDEERAGKVRDVSGVLNQRTTMGKTPLILASTAGQLDVVQFLLRQEGVDPNLVDEEHKAALHRAAGKGHTEVLACLLKHPQTRIKDSNPSARPPLFHAILNDQLEAARLLLEHGADIHWSGENGAQLLDACVQAQDATVQWLLKQPELRRQNGKAVSLPTVLNRPGSDGVTLLHQVAFLGHTRLVQRLLSHGADPHRQDVNGDTPLQYAVEAGHLETAKLLLPRRKSGINEPLPTGDTLLGIAIKAGKLAVAGWLLAQGADILKASNSGSTPLHAACATGALAARWLLNNVHSRHGAHAPEILNARNDEGESALHTAASEGATPIVRVLLAQKHIDPNTSDHWGWTPLLDAARHGAQDVVLQLLAHPDIDIFQKGPQGKTLLHCVAMGAHPQPLLDALREKLPPDRFQALKDLRDDFHSLPVSTAAERGASEAVLAILKPPVVALPTVAYTATTFKRGWIVEGSGMNSRDSLADQGRDAGIEMHTVGDGDDGEALSLQKLRRLDIRPGDFVIVRGHCSWNADLKQLEMSLNGGPSIPVAEIARTLFEMGVMKVCFLGCNINDAFRGVCNRLARDPMISRPQHGSTVLDGLDYTFIGRKDLTSQDLNTRAASLCLEDCAKQRLKTEVGGALFTRSVQPLRTIGFETATATFVLARRSSLDPDRLDAMGPAEASVVKKELLLHFAHAGKPKQATALLTRHGVDPNASTARGNTPLILACSTGRTHMVKLLLEHGADMDQVNDEGESALWEACSRGFAAIAKVLIAAGADPHAKDKEGVSAWDVAQRKGRTGILKLLPPPPKQTQTQLQIS